MKPASPSLDGLALERLPAVARELAETIGLRQALRLVEALGGTTFPVPKRENRAGELRFKVLAEVVGEPAAEAIVRRYGSTGLYIPRCADALRHARDAAICRDYDLLIQSMSGNDAVQRLARANHLSDRSIFAILKRVPATSTVNIGGAVQLKLLEI
jgi:hypothetical protein